MNKVLITGFGGVTACGMTIQDTWGAIKQGQSGIDTITQWDVSESDYPLGGELKAYNPRTMLTDRKLLKLLSRHDVIGLNAAGQAIEHSQLVPYRDSLTDAHEFNDRTGIYVGSPGNKFYQQHDFMPLFDKDMRQYAADLFTTVHPMWLLRILPNNVLAYTGIEYNFKGPNENITNHGISGLQALIEAMHAVRQGQVERAVVIAYDAALEAQGVFYYGNMGVLSQHMLRPFDVLSDGTILGEGAGAIILESEQSARQRNAQVYGELMSGTVTSEAQGIFPIQVDGLRRSIESTLCQTTCADVGMITAHGNGNRQSDVTEAAVMGQALPEVPVTSFKWAMGHTIAASGILDTILCLLSLREQIVPGIATLNQIAPEYKTLQVSQQSQRPRSSLGMVINRGFAGLNASLLLKATDYAD